jgi:hypothetical protein
MSLGLCQLTLNRMLQTPQIVNLSNISDNSEIKNYFAANPFISCYVCQSQTETDVYALLGKYAKGEPHEMFNPSVVCL